MSLFSEMLMIQLIIRHPKWWKSGMTSSLCMIRAKVWFHNSEKPFEVMLILASSSSSWLLSLFHFFFVLVHLIRVKWGNLLWTRSEFTNTFFLSCLGHSLLCLLAYFFSYHRFSPRYCFPSVWAYRTIANNKWWATNKDILQWV